MPGSREEMSNMLDIWDDRPYSFRNYIGRPAGDEDIAAAEKELGYKLPESYKQLIKVHNGGVLKKNTVTVDDTDYYAEGLYGIDPEAKHSLLSRQFGNRFWIEEWEYPEIGIVIADTPSAGHDMFFLDYRKCGPAGEPAVVLVDQEFDYAILPVADSFEEFLHMLHE